MLAGVSLPDHIDVTAAQVDRLYGPHLGRDIDQDAVTQIDSIIEPEETYPGPVQAREMLKNPFALDTRCRVSAKRIQRCLLGLSPTCNRNERVDATSRKYDNGG